MLRQFRDGYRGSVLVAVCLLATPSCPRPLDVRDVGSWHYESVKGQGNPAASASRVVLCIVKRGYSKPTESAIDRRVSAGEQGSNSADAV